MTTGEAAYTEMQVSQYENLARSSSFEPGIVHDDFVVCLFNEHNAWPDNHEYLIRHSKLPSPDVLKQYFLVLDFACGPGRNIVLYSDRFKQIDGVDLAEKNLSNAKIYTSTLPEAKRPVLYHCNGVDLKGIDSASYDMIISTIAMQHICCYSIRLGYLKEFHRVLKPGGFLCIQMGFGKFNDARDQNTVPYHDDDFAASTTNGGRDTRVERAEDLAKDLMTVVGFVDFEYNIRPSGPGDHSHPNWIYWSCRKPN